MRSARGRADRRVHGLFTVLVATCLVPALSGCVLVGDSVSAFMTAQLRTVVPIVDADFGRSLDQRGWRTQESGAQAVRRWEGLHPPWIIIQVGANDVNATGRCERVADLDPQHAGLGSEHPVRRLGPRLRRSPAPARSNQFNAVVEQEVASRHIPSTCSCPGPRSIKRGGMLADDVHLSTLGKATLTHLVAEAVSTFGRPRLPTKSATSALIEATGLPGRTPSVVTASWRCPSYRRRPVHDLPAMSGGYGPRHRGCAVRFAGSRPRVSWPRRSSGRE